MSARNPPAVEAGSVPDEPRWHTDAQETFALQILHLADDGGIKLIWWYIAAVNEEEEFSADFRERDRFGIEFHNYTDVLEKLTFSMDRAMVRKAIDIVEGTYGNASSLDFNADPLSKVL